MRALKTADIFSFARVIKASGIREELVGYLQELTVKKEADIEKVGINTILMLIGALSDKKAERAIYEALGPIFEMSAEEVEDMPPSELFASLKKLAEENNLTDFFGSLLGTIGKN